MRRRRPRKYRALWIALAVLLAAGVLAGAVMAIGSSFGASPAPETDSLLPEESPDKGSGGMTEGGDAVIPQNGTGTTDALTDHAAQEETAPTEEALRLEAAEAMLQGMTTEEKIAQLFLVTPEAITGAETVTQCGDTLRGALDKYPVGGLIFFAKNLETPQQTSEMLAGIQEHVSGSRAVPVFLSVDEEGGIVRRIGNNAAFGVTNVNSMGVVAGQGKEAVKQAAHTIGAYLKALGFNMDFAPVADILTNPENQVIGIRAFSSDPADTRDMAYAYAAALQEEGIIPVYKHFPGHGDTAEDSHTGYAYSRKTLEELWQAELIPFSDAVAQRMPVIMAAHISLPQVTGGDTPASLSKEIIGGLLRRDMGYDGVVITDALNMGAISNHYTPGEACVLALSAGCDLLLVTDHFEESYQAVQEALRNGTFTMTRIDESVRRILLLKLQM